MLTNIGKVRYHNSENIEPTSIAVHSAAPSVDGTTNRIQAPKPCTFDLAVIGDPEYRYLSADVEFLLTADTNYTHYSVYNSDNECIHIVAVAVPRALKANDKIVLQGSVAPRLGIRITSTT